MRPVEYLVVGGGFYGCSLALFLRSVSKDVLILEAGSALMNRASRVNQARIHTGYHYPRSVLTAAKSMALHRRFIRDFPDAVVGDFKMLYAIAKRRSKVSANRFYRMYRDMGAPIGAVTNSERALFDESMIEAVFSCNEYAFDYSILRNHMLARIEEYEVNLQMNAEVVSIEETPSLVVVRLSDGTEIGAKYVFNVTYAQTNKVLDSASLPRASLKYELAEVALIEPPEQLEGYGITVMDGPFFSVMPYPAENLYSLTHVRYTPHASWTNNDGEYPRYEAIQEEIIQSRNRHMILDGARYLPCLIEANWVRSLFDIKTILIKNEGDDGRPILYQRLPAESRVTSILGGKIDNIYDLFDLIKNTRSDFSNAHSGFVTSSKNNEVSY